MADDPDVACVVPAEPPAQVRRTALVAGPVAAVALVERLGFRSHESERR